MSGGHKLIFTVTGDYKKTLEFLTKLDSRSYLKHLNKYGEMGVKALQEATPKRTGKTAASWSYKIENVNGRTTLSFYNSNVNDGVNVAIILQYGHGTGTGGYVRGIDYINPALKPIFQQIADEAWEEVKKL